MKNLSIFTFSFLLILVASCAKTDPVVETAESLATKLVGTWNATSFKSDTTEYIKGAYTMKLKFSDVTGEKGKYKLEAFNNNVSVSETLGEFTITTNGTKISLTDDDEPNEDPSILDIKAISDTKIEVSWIDEDNGAENKMKFTKE